MMRSSVAATQMARRHPLVADESATGDHQGRLQFTESGLPRKRADAHAFPCEQSSHRIVSALASIDEAVRYPYLVLLLE